MSLTIQQIADIVSGQIASGDARQPIHGVASLAEAQETDLSFFGNSKYLPELKTTRAGAILVPPDLPISFSGTAIAVENPSLAFSQVMSHFLPESPFWTPGVHPAAVVSPQATIDPSASIQPFAVIEPGATIGPGTVIGAHSYVGHGSTLGRDCHIHPHVTIRERAQIGDRVIIHSGTVIGSDGYGYEKVDGRHQKISQIGIVQLDNDVEIGANTTIDRARFGRTWIGEGTKIDNLVQIAHNVVIGKHSLIIAQAGISGSTQIGNSVIIAGGAGIVGHIKIGDQAIITAKAGISKNVPPGTKWMGYYAEPAKEMAEKLAYVSRLPKLFARVKALETLSQPTETISNPSSPQSPA